MKSIVFSSIAALLLMNGCEDKQVSTARARADTDDHYGIVLSQQQGGQLRHDTAFDQERISRDPYGLLHVTVPLRSTVQHTLYLEYRYTFFDGTGTPVEGPLGWQPVTLEAGSPNTVAFASTSPKAANYQLNFRYQR